MTTMSIEFDQERANQYDFDIRKAIPGYEALHDMAQSLLENSLSSSANLLVVGSGTGMELVKYSRKNPQWLLTGIDPSSEMMTIAQKQLARYEFLDRISLHTGYVNSLPETELFDGATLILVMHFLSDDGSKLNLLKNVASHLKVGSEIILADLYGDKSSNYFAKFKQAWQTLYFSQLDDTARVKAEQNFEISINNSIYFVPETRILELLSLAGFSSIAKFYNAFLFGGWVAKYTGS